jgi:small subunit ribosomal protein S15
MALLREAKTELIKQYRQHETDSGSPEVQIAVLTNRITYLTEHFKLHKKDLRGVSDQRYRAVIERLGIRK